MINLPKWILTSGRPANYDSESATAIEMVAKLYGSMETLINEYNETINQLQKDIETFENNTNNSNECFKTKMIEIMNDFVDSMNMIHDRHTKEIEEAVYYMKDGLSEKIEIVVNEMVQNGELDETIVQAVGGFETRLNDMDDRVNTLEENKLTFEYEGSTETIYLR